MGLISLRFVGTSRTPRGIIHVSSRFRRDPRALEEEEESWFDQDDDEEQNGGDDVMPPINASVKSPEDNLKPCNSFPATNDVMLPSPSNKVVYEANVKDKQSCSILIIYFTRVYFR